MKEANTSEEQKKKVLVALLSAFLLVMAWRFVVPAVSAGLDSLSKRNRSQQITEQTLSIAGKEVVMVDLGQLGATAGEYESKRNIFRFGERPRKAPAPPPPVVPTRIEPRTPTPPPPVVREEPKPPPVTFQLLGIFGPDDRRIAALLDGPEIVNALESDILKDQFIVNQIGYESVEFGFVGFPKNQTTRLEMGTKKSSRRRF